MYTCTACPCRYVRALRSSFADQHDAMKKSAQGVWVAQLKVLDNEEEAEEGGGWVGGWVNGREGGAASVLAPALHCSFQLRQMLSVPPPLPGSALVPVPPSRFQLQQRLRRVVVGEPQRVAGAEDDEDEREYRRMRQEGFVGAGGGEQYNVGGEYRRMRQEGFFGAGGGERCCNRM